MQIRAREIYKMDVRELQKEKTGNDAPLDLSLASITETAAGGLSI
jgi:hypothetical protein